MIQPTEQKKVFLIVSPDEARTAIISDAIQKIAADATIYKATDGSEALIKFQNVPCHILITELNLEKTTGLRLIESIISKEKVDTAFIVLSEPPQQAQFTEEVVKGKVQFLVNLDDPTSVIQCLIKSLNHANHLNPTEFRKQYLAAGHVLLKEGEKAKSVYILKRGRMRAHVLRADTEVTLGFIEPGEFVGEMSYISGEERSATVQALVDCELVEIPIQSLEHVLFRKPTWSRALLSTLSRRLKTANEK